jgi:predicted nucleic acid-binding protein
VAGISEIVCVVVCDAGPLIHLDELGALDLLADFPAILVPDVVWSEVARHRPGLFADPGPSFTGIVPEHRPGPALMALSRLFPLHAGETQALAVVAEQGADLLLTDDTAARLAATQLGHRVHGTLGILVRAVRRSLRAPTEVAALLRAIPSRSTLHIRPALLDEIVAEVDWFEAHGIGRRDFKIKQLIP